MEGAGQRCTKASVCRRRCGAGLLIVKPDPILQEPLIH